MPLVAELKFLKKITRDCQLLNPKCFRRIFIKCQSFSGQAKWQSSLIAEGLITTLRTYIKIVHNTSDSVIGNLWLFSFEKGKEDWLLIQVQAIFHALASSHPLQGPNPNTALICGEKPPNIPSPA